MDKIKFAVVGCGNIGVRHVALIDANPRARLSAICDKDIEVAKTLSAKFGHVPFYSDYKEMLVKADADIISICTPHYLHSAMAIAAADSKRNVLVEKPMAIRSSECEEMNHAAERNKVKLFVVKQNRFNLPVRLATEALGAKKLGRIFMIKCDVLWNRNNEYYSGSEWRGRKKFEGGVLFTQASHFIDLLVWWFGEITEAKTILETKNHPVEVEDCGSSMVKFKSGVLGSLNWTTCVYDKNYEGSITIIGEYGTIKIGGQYLNKIEYWDVKDNPLPPSIEYTDKPNSYGKYQGTSSNHDQVIDSVIANLMHEQSGVVEGLEGMKTVMAIEKIYAGC